MKFTIRYILVVIFSVALLFSCTKPIGSDNQDNMEGPELPDLPKDYLFALVDEGAWKDGDSVGVFILGVESKMYFGAEIFISEDLPVLAIETDRVGKLNPGDTVQIHTPYINKKIYQHPSDISFDIPPVQKQVGDVFDLYPEPLLSSVHIVDSTICSDIKEFAGTLMMNQQYSTAKFIITNESDGLSGQQVVSLTWNSEGLIDGFSGNNVVTETIGLVIPASGNRFEICMAVSPGVHSGSVILKTDKTEIERSLHKRLFENGVKCGVEISISLEEDFTQEPDDDVNDGSGDLEEEDDDDEEEEDKNNGSGDKEDNKDDSEKDDESDSKQEINGSALTDNESFKDLNDFEW